MQHVENTKNFSLPSWDVTSCMCAKDAHSAPPQVHDHGKFSVNPGSLPGLAHLFLLSSIWTEGQSMQRPSVKLTICKECVRKGGKLEQYLSKEGARKVHDAQILVHVQNKRKSSGSTDHEGWVSGQNGLPFGSWGPTLASKVRVKAALVVNQDLLSIPSIPFSMRSLWMITTHQLLRLMCYRMICGTHPLEAAPYGTYLCPSFLAHILSCIAVNHATSKCCRHWATCEHQFWIFPRLHWPLHLWLMAEAFALLQQDNAPNLSVSVWSWTRLNGSKSNGKSACIEAWMCCLSIPPRERNHPFSSADSCGHVAKGNHRICSRSAGKSQWYRLKPHNSRMLLAACRLFLCYLFTASPICSQCSSFTTGPAGDPVNTKASVSSILWPRLINISSCLNASTIIRYPKSSMNCWLAQPCIILQEWIPSDFLTRTHHTSMT